MQSKFPEPVPMKPFANENWLKSPNYFQSLIFSVGWFALQGRGGGSDAAGSDPGIVAASILHFPTTTASPPLLSTTVKS